MRYNRTKRKPLVNKHNQLFRVSDSIYAANDVLGGTGKCIYGSDGGGLLLEMSVLDVAKKNIPLSVRFYKSEPTLLVDNDPMSIDVASGKLEIGKIQIDAALYEAVPGALYTKAYKQLNIKIDEVSKGAIWYNIQNLDEVTYDNPTDLFIELAFWCD